MATLSDSDKALIDKNLEIIKEIQAKMKTTHPDKWKEMLDKEYSDFLRCFPVVAIDVITGKFCKRAFVESFTKQLRDRQSMSARLEMAENLGKFGKKSSRTGLESMIAAQADYARRQYMYTTDHFDPKRAREVYDAVYQAQMKEARALKHKEEEVREERNTKAEEYRKEKLTEIKRLVRYNAQCRTMGSSSLESH